MPTNGTTKWRGFALLACLSSLAFGQPGAQPAAQPVTQPVTQPQATDIGSADGARIAYPIPAGAERPTLRFVTGRMSDGQLAELAEAAPNVEFVFAASGEEAMRLAPTAHAIDGRFATPELIAAAPNLVWVLSNSAGVDQYLDNRALMETDRIVLTNMRAVHGPAIADHAMAMLLTLTRNMPAHLRNQRDHRWGSPDARTGIALQGRTMFVVGLGGIGTEIAQRAHGFGMRVIGSRRSDKPNPDFIERVGKPEDLLSMLPEADVVAVAVPLTPETEGMFDERAFGAMKEGAYLINIARGPIVETDALLAALESGQLAGACLDVTDPEPLPADSPLWDRPDVVITPHSASVAELTNERRWVLFKENIRRFGAGEPLLNTVDKAAGY
jgi:phosphoglycerate dehydrogenase-like enzyme